MYRTERFVLVIFGLFCFCFQAYSMSDKTTSATGITLLCRYKTTHAVILGLEEYYLKEQTGNATNDIAILVTNSVMRVTLAHNSHFQRVLVIIEANSCPDNVPLISTKIKAILRVITPTMRVYFGHYNARIQSSTTKLNSNSGTNAKRIGFWLGQEKRSMVDTFIYQFEAGKILTSYSVYSYTSQDPVDQLVDQLRVLRYDTKPQNRKQDDVAISTVCAFNHLLQLNNQQYSHMYSEI